MQEQLISLLISLPAVLIALTVHEVSHGYAAYKLGDPTARSLGRLSLNPLKHLDPIGCLCMLLFRFGWAKPVPINARYFKKPRRDMAITALAGPLSNLALGFVGIFLFLAVQSLIVNVFPAPETQFSYNVIVLVLTFFQSFYLLNISLAVFNLIPIPPLDGSRIFLVFLPPKLYFGVMKYERYLSLLLLLCLWLGVLSGPLSFVVTKIIAGMSFVIQLIPFL